MIALVEKGLPFDQFKVDLGNKPPQFAELYHSIIPDQGMKEQVPLLVDGPTTRLVDASVICSYIAREYSNLGTPLLPAGAAAQARVDLFIRLFQQRVLPPYNHLIHAPAGSAAAADAAADLLSALRGVDTFLSLHGPQAGAFALGPHYQWQMRSGEYTGGEDAGETGADAAAAAAGAGAPAGAFLLGDAYSLAEVECTPWVARMVEVLPAWRGVDVRALVREQRLGRLAAWMEACLARASAQETGPSGEALLRGMESWEEAAALQ